MNSKFSTKDHDRDAHEEVNCAETNAGGWWYHRCTNSNLNGLYLVGETTEAQAGKGVTWDTWLGNQYSLKGTQMKFRPIYD